MADTSGTAIEKYRRKNRVLLIFAPSPHDLNYVEQRRLFSRAEAGFDDRDLLVFYLFTNEASTGQLVPEAALRERFCTDEDVFAAVLIGKDGSEKKRFLEPVHPATLFGVIDQMPMRQREVKRSN